MTEMTKSRKAREWRKADGSDLPPARLSPADLGQADLFGNGPNAASLISALDRSPE